MPRGGPCRYIMVVPLTAVWEEVIDRDAGEARLTGRRRLPAGQKRHLLCVPVVQFVCGFASLRLCASVWSPFALITTDSTMPHLAAAPDTLDNHCVMCQLLHTMEKTYHTMERVPMETTPKNHAFNRSLERALHILCAFDRKTPLLTLTQLARTVNIPKTTTARLCATLIEFGFLRYDQKSCGYSLGLKLFELGSVVYSTFSLRTVASPFLVRFLEKTAKTVFLAVFENDQVLYIDKREDPANPVIFASNVGTRRPPCFGMFGQLFMAYMSEAEVDRILRKTPLSAPTSKSIVDEEVFRKRLGDIRKNGFLVEDGEAIPGVTGISAPILDCRGRVVAAVGASFISATEDANGKQGLVAEVVATARDISLKLGFSEDPGAKTANEAMPEAM